MDDIVSVWQTLKDTHKPIVMYGMGDGAEKIMGVMEKKGIKPSAFMASDDFVRGHSFMGFPVQKLSEIQEKYEDFIIVVCFGTNIPEVMDRIYNLSEQYELYAPDVPVTGDGLFDEDFLYNHQKELADIRGMLADEVSVKTFDCLIRYRLTGKIDYLKECETDKSEAYRLLGIRNQETYVDLGAYNGDTTEEFLRLTGKRFKEIYAVEPDRRNYDKMRRRLYMLGSAIFHPENAAAWDEDTELDFYRRSGRSGSLQPSLPGSPRTRPVKIPAKKTDTLLEGKKATLIKFDVEGSESRAITGAEKTIRMYKPKLIVSAYHRTEDIIDLPRLIKSFHGGYRFYLRHHPYIPAWDTNLYCL